MPNFIEIQKDSYNWFIKEGLAEVFRDISPIEDHGGKLKLIFGDFRLCYEDIKYTIDECKERDATYSVPLRVDVSLEHIDEDGNKPLVTVNSVYMGDLPLMNDTGSFVINGAERVIVSQLVRSPGIYYDITKDKAGKPLFTSQVIPNRGAWLEYETDSNDVFYVRVDRTRKVPVTCFLRALGVGTNEEILEMFGPEPKLLATFEKDPSDSRERGLLELYKKIRPGEPLSVDSADSLLRGMLFDVRRYDLAKVGRYKFNKKLNFRFRLAEQVLAEDVIDQTTGEVLAEAGTVLTRNSAEALQDAGVPYVYVKTEEHGEEKKVKILSNMMVDPNKYLPFDAAEAGITEKVYYPVLQEILAMGLEGEELMETVKQNLSRLVPKHVTPEDIFGH